MRGMRAAIKPTAHIAPVPASTITRARACATKKVPVRLTARMRSKVARSTPREELAAKTPATRAARRTSGTDSASALTEVPSVMSCAGRDLDAEIAVQFLRQGLHLLLPDVGKHESLGRVRLREPVCDLAADSPRRSNDHR